MVTDQLRSLAKWESLDNDQNPQDHITWIAADEIDRLRADSELLRGANMELRGENVRLRAKVEALRADAERFRAVFSHMAESYDSPWGQIEGSEYAERIDAGEPLIDVIREAIDKHLRGEEE